jgi:hypothetical protein
MGNGSQDPVVCIQKICRYAKCMHVRFSFLLKLLLVSSFGSMAIFGCTSAPKKVSSSLDKGRQTQDERWRKTEMARIDREIRRMRAGDLVTLEKPAPRPLPRPLTQESLYLSALEAYRKSDLRGLRFFDEHMGRLFPDSLFRDRIVFLTGKLLQKKGHWARSLVYFQRVVDRYPRSNKVPGALMHKGMVYRELQLNDLARQAFMKVRKDFKGSPEYFQVEMELRLLGLNTKKKV